MNLDNFERPVNLAKAAELMDVPKETVRRECVDGNLPARKVRKQWRILPSSIEQYLKGSQDVKPASLKGSVKWQSTNAAKRGISTSNQTGSEYANLLTRQTSKKRKNSTTS